MYSQPSTAEQCLHNALKVVNAMRSIGIDYDIQAIDITDPNPISLMLLCVHLYSTLPQYLPKNHVEFIGALHATSFRQVWMSLTLSPVLPVFYRLLRHFATCACRCKCIHRCKDFKLPLIFKLFLRGNLKLSHRYMVVD